MFLENSQNSQENTCARVSFLIKLQASGLQLYQKRNYGKDEHLFRNVERHSGQNSIFIEAEQKYHTKVYNIILIFLVWAASKLLPTNVVNVLVFSSALNSRIATLN